MAFGQDFLQGFIGGQNLKDYAHASKTFRTNGYELAPRNKFLFHTYFNLNTSQIPVLNGLFNTGDKSSIGLLVKSIQLPTFVVDTEVLNQYNRKRVIQKRINYQPIQIEFHDDAGDLSRNLWYNYYSYYFKDPAQAYGSTPSTDGTSGNQVTKPGFRYNGRDIYSNDRPVNDWGYIGESYYDGTQCSPGDYDTSGKPQFFTDITIYGLNQHQFASYTLVNPIIKEWRHDTYDYSQGNGTMTNTCTIEYETVKYFSGAIGASRPDTNVKGFADPAHYDTIRSSLARPGSTATVLGNGGLLDAAIGIIEDLEANKPLGAVQKALTAYNTWSKVDIQAALGEEATAELKKAIENYTGGFSLPW